MKFPDSYCIENALKSAWLILQGLEGKGGKLAILTCSQNSIANSLLDMVVQGLSPAKKQCYFIAYGGDLKLQRSYFGTIAVTKRLHDVKDIRSQIIFKHDEIQIEINNGSRQITKHVQRLENIDITKIKGAYTVIEKTDGTIFTEIMNMKQIEQSWKQSKTSYNIFDEKGKVKEGSVHGKFTDQMCLKTVAQRACKTFANTSNDNDILIESFNRTTDGDFKQENEQEKDINQEIKENANKDELDFETVKESDVIDTEFQEVEEEETQETSRGF